VHIDLRFSKDCCQCTQVLRGLSSALPDRILILPDMLSALPGLLSALPGLSPALPGTPRCVVGTSRCSPGNYQTSYVYLDFLLVLPDAPDGHCISPLHSGISPHWDSGPTTARHSHRLPVTIIRFADVRNYGEKRVMKDTYHLSRPNAEGTYTTQTDCADNIRLEWSMG